MAGEDKTLKVKIVTEADTSGLKDVQTELDKMKGALESRGVTAGDQLKALGLNADGSRIAIKAINEEAAKLPEFLNIGRFQAAALSRELVDGAFNARTIGVSLASFGAPVAVAGIAMFTVVEALRNVNKEQEKWLESVLKTTAEIDKLQQSILEVQDTLRETALIVSLPLGAGIKLATQEVERLKTEQSLVNFQTKEGLEEYKKYSGEIEKAQHLVDELTKKQQAQTGSVQKTTDQIALNRAYGDEELTIQEKVRQVYDAKLRSLLEAHVPQALAKDLATETAESERNKLESMRGQETAQSGLNELLRQAQMIIQGIRQQQQLVQTAPFLGADQKQIELLHSYQAELQQVQAAITAIQSKKTTLIDPSELQRADQELQKLVFNAKELGLKIEALTHPIQAQLQQWVNSFGTAAQQIAKTIEGSINAALQGTNQLLLDAVFKTGNWQQVLMGVERQILNLFLTMLEQMALQRVMAMFNSKLAAGDAAITGPAIAASWAGAATAVSVATEGQADLTAPGQFAAALALIQGMLAIPKAHKGGSMRRMHYGGLSYDEVPIIAQEGEIMIQRSVAQQPGMADFLLGLNSGMFHRGGGIRRMHRGGEGSGDLWTPGMFDPTFWWGTPSFTEPGPLGGQPSPTPSDNWAGPSDVLNPWRTSMWDQGWQPSDFGSSIFSPSYFPPMGGTPAYGPTMSPTTWSVQDLPGGGVGWVPNAIAIQTPGYTETEQRPNALVSTQHFGGRIGRLHSGGSVGGLPSRFHSGGSVDSNVRGGGVHIYAFTDLKELTNHMASREGQKIIFDTIKGRRIDLGI